MITKEHSQQLRRPFAPLAVKFLPVGKIDTQGYASYLTYIDASLVIERLSEVDPGWTATGVWEGASEGDPFGLKHGAGRRCDLTVCGVTREGIGQLTMREDYQTKQPITPRVDDKHLKEAASDAFKRAALMFEVGAYLRNMGDNFRIPEEKDGKKLWWGYTKTENGKQVKKLGGLNAAGKQELRRLYAVIVEHPKFIERYGIAQSYGAIEIIETDGPETVPDNEDSMPPIGLQIIEAMYSASGREVSSDYIEATYTGQPFEKILPKVLAGVRGPLGLDAKGVQQLRQLARGAVSSESMIELEDALEVLQTSSES